MSDFRPGVVQFGFQVFDGFQECHLIGPKSRTGVFTKHIFIQGVDFHRDFVKFYRSRHIFRRLLAQNKRIQIVNHLLDGPHIGFSLCWSSDDSGQSPPFGRIDDRLQVLLGKFRLRAVFFRFDIENNSKDRCNDEQGDESNHRVQHCIALRRLASSHIPNS